MAPITVRPTRPDLAIANAVAGGTGRRTERAAEFLTWGADEHVLCALAAGWWLYSRGKKPEVRRAADHVLLTTLVASGLPHLLKRAIDQERPDRGVPLSGRRLDAFPSGHAVHIGALASAASTLPGRQRNAIWSIGAALVATRVILLAHWASDVAAGLVVGALTERVLRLVTGYGERETSVAGPKKARVERFSTASPP